jgi:N-acetylneuraminate synthase/sialic acid synthase
MLPPKAAEEVGKEAVFQKLGKSVVAYRDIAKGEVLSLENLSGRIFNEQYIPVRETARLLNRKAVRNIAKGELIRNGDFEGPS